MKPAIFIDRDGVINYKAKPHDYIKSWNEFRFYKNAIKALRFSHQNGYFSVMISNQRGIGRGVMSHDDLLDIHDKMLSELKKSLGSIDKLYYCPHDYSDKCDCRKPGVGMLLRAAQENDIDLKKSFMIDDAKEGIEAGAKAGCTTVLVLTGMGQESLKIIGSWNYQPNYVARDLWSAVHLIDRIQRGVQTKSSI